MKSPSTYLAADASKGHIMMSRLSRGAAVALAAVWFFGPLPKALAAPMQVESRAQLYKRAQIAQLFEGAERLAERREHRDRKDKRRAASSKTAKKSTEARAERHGGEHREVPADVRETGGRQGGAWGKGLGRPAADANPVPTRVQAALAPNRIVNNRAGDHSDAGQAEVSIAAFGSNIVAAWNDGEGFYGSPGNTSTQGFAYSNDGGLTWNDGGVPPLSGGVTEWTSDPVLTVNEKTGVFYYAALCNTGTTTNGVAVVRGTFAGGALTWGTPKVARSLSNATFFLDKPWVVADSLSGIIYLTYSTFDFTGAGTNRIEMQRQTDPNNAAAWSTQVTVNTTDAGRVQGSRPVVGPNGELYVAWYSIGTVDQDFFRVRKSTTQGTSFGAQITAASIYANFGTGAPGFNRGQGITFPSISVDRSTGPRRGRVYLAWNESVNFFNDPIGGTIVNETEGNDTPANADNFTIGQTVNGSLGNSNDFDYYRL